MKKKLISIAVATFKESIRDKLFIFIAIFNLILILSTGLLAPLVLGQFEKIVKDLGLASIHLFGIIFAILIGTRLIYDEIDKRTIYFILSKPITRSVFIAGKYFGLLFTILFFVILMTAGFYFAQIILLGKVDVTLFIAILFITLQLSIIIALTLLFPNFVSPIASGIFTFFIYFIGNFINDFVILSQTIKIKTVQILINIVAVILPNFSFINIKNEVVYHIPIPLMSILWRFVYAVLYTIFLLLIACGLFERKEF